jgi:hypothetical protein
MLFGMSWSCSHFLELYRLVLRCSCFWNDVLYADNICNLLLTPSATNEDDRFV